jgi:guanylate kinase
VDVKGSMSIKKLYPDQTMTIFVLPPSLEHLRSRLIKRGTDSEERIAKRLERLEIEIEYKEKFDFSVINDDIQRATEEIISIINKQNEGVLHGS